MNKLHLPLSKRTVIIAIVSAVVVAVAASAIVATLHFTIGNNTEPTVTESAETTELKNQARSTYEKASEAVLEGKNDEAIELYKQAREQYITAQANTEFGDANPSPEVVDTEIQINLLENMPDPEVAPVMVRDELPETE